MRKFDASTELCIMTAEQVRQVDRWAIEEMHVPSVVLMENAGRSCAEYILASFGDKPSACILCGTGNNGGDGFVIARHLSNAGCKVKVVICGDAGKIKGDAAVNLNIIRAMGLAITVCDPGLRIDAAVEGAADSTVVVDAIFGTGLSGTPKPGYLNLIRAINSLGKDIVAVDIPSGLDCDTGRPLGEAVCAKATITFAAAKTGFKNPDALKYTGQIYIASIGIEPAASSNQI